MDTTCKCGSIQIAKVYGRCVDQFQLIVPGYENDYNNDVPAGIGIGHGDFMEFSYCLDCGQIQGEFPISQKLIHKVMTDY